MDVAITPGQPETGEARRPSPGCGESWSVEPYLHWGDGKVYNPLTDRTLSGSAFAVLDALRSGATTVERLDATMRRCLRAAAWLVRDTGGEDLARRFWLKYVSLETHTVCNQSCYFCPVAYDPRKAYFMPTELFERVVGEIAVYRESLEGVWLMNYNEPTVDRRFVDQCRTLLAAGLKVGVNSNGSGLTPAKVDALVDSGPLRFLSINLSTLDRERYHRDRGQDQLPRVLRNLDYAKDRPVAEEMVVVVLGTGDERHDQEAEAARRYFAGSRFEVTTGRIMDRAGHIDVGLKPASGNPRLCGCDNVGSRPLQHLHITPHGKCVLCCEDYDEQYQVGDLNQSSVEEVLTGDRIATLRRWVYGLEDSPDDFLCKGCIFARTR
jgi:hypothetical protein